jgi:tRNA nucleotidyltransferase/poly(A) polymerase
MMHNGTSIDIVMCRKESGSLDGRHPEHVEPGTLKDDLQRRDFTVNALAREVNPTTLEPIGEIIDLFGGIADAEAKHLRTVGIVEDRLEEDGLRILRAVRFAVTKGLTLDLHLMFALNNEHWWHHVRNSVSEDRVRVEVHKMMSHDTAKTIRFLTASCHDEALDTLFSRGNIWLKPTLEKK